MMSNSNVRVRFAPSPTGPLHMGGVRTALFNYLFARQHNGAFILRIEDTDSQRFVPGAEQYIINALKWCGIEPNEGLTADGQIAETSDSKNPYAPYRQSQRKTIYRQYAEQLVASGHAYYAFDTAEELEILRKKAEGKKENFTYNYAVRPQLKNSLNESFPKEEITRLLKDTNNWVIRFKIPENREVKMRDLIRGDITVNSNTLDDKALWKAADGLPTYHLANIVDDHVMCISHVIRGEEWLPSLPLHYLLYEAFGWQDSRPQFAHLSLLLKPDGKGKLSKRDGDRLGFPVFPLQWTSPEGEVSRGYREDGYFPEAFVNMLALLGWNPGTAQEIFSLNELITVFGLERVIKSGAKFNPEKAKWFNQQYMKAKPAAELALLYQAVLQQGGLSFPNDYVARVCGFIKERASLINEFWDLSSYFFVAPNRYDEKAKQKHWKEGTPALMRQLHKLMDEIVPFEKELVEQLVCQWINDNNFNTGAVMNAFRLCIVGDSKGPGMFEIVSLIGKEETLRRLEKAMKVLFI